MLYIVIAVQFQCKGSIKKCKSVVFDQGGGEARSQQGVVKDDTFTFFLDPSLMLLYIILLTIVLHYTIVFLTN